MSSKVVATQQLQGGQHSDVVGANIRPLTWELNVGTCESS